MFKQVIKRFCYKIYSIGKIEDIRINSENRAKHLHQMAVIDDSAHISDEANIYNSRDRSKVTIGKGTRLMGDLFTFHHDGGISIGDHCFIGPLSKIWSARNIKIGNRVLIAHNVNIHDNISHPIDPHIRHEEFVQFVNTGVHEAVDLKAQEVIIEDDVWIGFNSIILKGVTIGKGAIIGAGSVVTKNVEPWTVSVGNPLRLISKFQPQE